jgi:hypothetical protein
MAIKNFDYAAARRDFSDDQILQGLKAAGEIDFDVDAALKDGHDASEILRTILPKAAAPAPAPQSASVIDRAKDAGISALKGAISVPEAAVGLADIVSGGAAGKYLESVGFRPGEAKQILNDYYSDAQKAANQKVADTKGFLPTIGAMAQNPSTIIQTGIESLPSMGAGGAIGRGALALAPKIGAALAGAVGEGVVGAGSTAEQVRQQSTGGDLSLAQSGAALASGIGTGAFAAVGGRIAEKLGISDIDTALVQAGAPAASSKGVARRLLEGAVSEGVFEELPQSIQEQIWQNAAMDKPLLDGVPENAAQGLIAGGLFGGIAGAALHGKSQAEASDGLNQDPEHPGPIDYEQTEVPSALSLVPKSVSFGNELNYSQPSLLVEKLSNRLERKISDPFMTFKDGSVARKSNAEAYINNLPEAQRESARARLFGGNDLTPQPMTAQDVLQAQSVDDSIAIAARAVEEGSPEFQARRNADIDAGWSQHLRDRANQWQSDFDAAEAQRRASETEPLLNEVADQNVAQAGAVTSAQGFGLSLPNQMQTAMQEARNQQAARKAEQLAAQRDAEVGGAYDARNAEVSAARQSQFDLAEEQRKNTDAIDSTIQAAKQNTDLANSISEEIGTPASQPTAIQLAMQEAQAKRTKQNQPVAVDNMAQAREILSAAGVTGNDRMSALRSIRTGENTIEDLIDAHPPKQEVTNEPAGVRSGIRDERSSSAEGSAPVQQRAEAGSEVAAQPVDSGQAIATESARPSREGVANAVAPAASPALARVSGRKIDADWTEFARQSGTLGIGRDQMPQVKAGHRGALTQYLAARGITHETTEVPAGDLKPTQREFSNEKVQRARDYDGGDRSILISSDNHVLDGHHQWLAKLDSNEPVKVIRLDAPIRELLAEVHDFPSSQIAKGAQESAAPATPKTGVQTEVEQLRAARDARIEAQRNKPKTEQQQADERKFARQEEEIAKAKENAERRRAERDGNPGQTTPRKSEAPAAGRMTAADVNKAITNLKAKWLGFTRVNVVQSVENIPAEIQARAQAGAGTEGIYDPKTKTVYLIADNIASPARAAWVAAHEVSHAGLRMLHDKSVNEALNLAGANKFVKELAAAIQKDRGDVSASVSVEEAIAELSAANEQNDFAALEKRYGVKVPAASRNGVIGVVARVYDAVKRFLASVTGRPVAEVSDADVRALIGEQQAAVEQYDGKSTNQGEDNELSANDRAKNEGSEGFWKQLEQFRSGRFDFSSEAIASAYAEKDSGRTRDVLAIHRDEQGNGQEVVRFGGNVAGYKGYRTVATQVGDTFFMSVLPNSLTSDMVASDYHNLEKVGDRSVINLSLEKKGGRWELHVTEPDPDSIAYSDLEDRGRVSKLDAYDGDHQYSHVDLSGGVDTKQLLSELVRRFAFSQGKTPTVFSPGRDTGANRNRERVYSPDQIEARFSQAPLQSRAPAAPEEVIPKWAENLPEAQKAALRKSGVIYTEETFKQKVAKLKEGALKKLQYGILDQFAPIKDQLGRIPYVMARMAKNADGTLEALMLYGRPHLDGDGGMLVDTTKKGFIEMMQSLNGEHDRFFSWMAGRRAEQLKKEGRENLFTNDDISALSSLNQGQMKDGTSREAAYLRAQKDVSELNKSVLDIAEKSGLIDAESRKVWASDFYVPFYRVMEEGITGPSVKSGLVNQKSIKKLKGGTNNLGDLTENMLRNWSTLLTASAKNRAAKASLDTATAIGAATEADEATIRNMGKAANTKAVSYMENGVNRWHVVEDDNLLAAITALEFNGYNNQAMKAMAWFKNTLTKLVTVSPYFKVRNLIRDSLSVLAVSDINRNPLVNIKNGYSLMRNHDARAQMVAGGGIYRFGMTMEGNRAEHIKQLIDSGVADDTILNTSEKMTKFLKKLWNAYEEVGDLSENVNRAALYQKLRNEGVSHLEASFEARDLMDFGLSGAWAGVRALNQILPFLNARLQGLRKLGIGYNDDPKRMMYVVGALTLATIALSLAFKDDDDFKKRSDSDRNNYWWFKVGGTAYRIPRPFEIGAVASAIDNFSALFYDSENTNAERFTNQLSELVNGQLAMNPIPQVFRPLIDVYSNKDAFSGRPIESLAMQRLRPEDRYTSNTSEMARLLSKSGVFVDPVSLVAGTGVRQLSPVQIDSLIKGYFAGAGALAVAGADGLLHHTLIDRGAALPVPLKTLTGSFAEDLPSNSSRYVDMLYKTAQDVEQTYASYQNALKQGDIEKARGLMKDEGATIAKYHMIESLKKNESRIGQVIQRTMNDKNLTGEQKAETIRRLKAAQDKIARKLVMG